MDSSRKLKFELNKFSEEMYNYAFKPEKLKADPETLHKIEIISGYTADEICKKIIVKCIICREKFSISPALNNGLCGYCSYMLSFYHEAAHATAILLLGLEIEYVSGVTGKAEAKIKVEGDPFTFEENNAEKLLITYLAGPIAESIALNTTNWINDQQLLDTYLTKLLKVYISTIEFENFLLNSFSDLVLKIFLSGYFDFVYYFALAAKLNPNIKKAFHNKKVHKDLINSLKYDIIKVKDDLCKAENWKLVCKIAGELIKSKTITGDQVSSIFFNHNSNNKAKFTE